MNSSEWLESPLVPDDGTWGPIGPPDPEPMTDTEIGILIDELEDGPETDIIRRLISTVKHLRLRSELGEAAYRAYLEEEYPSHLFTFDERLRYRELIALRQAERLTDAELAELTALSGRMEGRAE